MSPGLNSNWVRVELKSLLEQQKREVVVEPNEEYRVLGAHWYAKGLYVKDVKHGSEIRAIKVYKVKERDFVYNRLFAWKGSFAIASADDNDCVVSNEFPCFIVNDEMIEPDYLWMYFSRLLTWSEALGLSYGATPTSRNRLNETKLLEMRIPLPPLSEQRRLVGTFQQVISRTENAKTIITELEHESRAFVSSCVTKISASAPYRAMKDVCPVVRRPVKIEPSSDYPELGIRSFGKGTFHKQPVKGSEIGSKRIFSILPGDLLFSNVFAWEGAIAVAQQKDAARYGSHRFITCVPAPASVRAEFLCSYFLTEEGIEKIGAASPGGAGRNRTLNIKKLEAITVPVPGIGNQEVFCSLLAGIQRAQAERNTLGESIESIIPSLLQGVFDQV